MFYILNTSRSPFSYVPTTYAAVVIIQEAVRTNAATLVSVSAWWTGHSAASRKRYPGKPGDLITLDGLYPARCINYLSNSDHPLSFP